MRRYFGLHTTWPQDQPPAARSRKDRDTNSLRHKALFLDVSQDLHYVEDKDLIPAENEPILGSHPTFRSYLTSLVLQVLGRYLHAQREASHADQELA